MMQDSRRRRPSEPLFGAGVGHEVFCSQVLAVEVCVDLGGGDIRMPQYLLDEAQVGTALQQMGSAAVAQRVGV